MYIVSFGGGLGSQMDQYAFYLSLKKHYPNVNVKMDIHNLFIIDHNGFELDRVFGIKRDEAPLNKIIELSDFYPHTGPHYRIYQHLFALRCKIFGPKESFIQPEDPSVFYPEVFQLSSLKSYIFMGNWGNDKYKEGVEDEIRESFRFKELHGKNSEISAEMQNVNSVSIHVRHGDFQSYDFPILSLEYYRQAIALIMSKVEDPFFYFFSDDPQYVKDNFSFLNNSFKLVENNKGDNSYIDMQLMSFCKHNIIANSTFSYWGAWLNNYSDKIVIVPRYHVSRCKKSLFYIPHCILLDNHKF